MIDRKKVRKRFQVARTADRYSQDMARRQGSAIDLGTRENTTKGPRAGEKFREVVSGGKSYHVYSNPDGSVKQVVAVKAPGAEKIVPRLKQMQSVGPSAGSAMPMPKRTQETMRQNMRPALGRLPTAKRSEPQVNDAMRKLARKMAKRR